MYDNEIVLDYKLHELAAMWEETSYQIEKLQANVNCVEEEYRTLPNRKMPPYRYSLPLNPVPHLLLRKRFSTSLQSNYVNILFINVPLIPPY